MRLFHSLVVAVLLAAPCSAALAADVESKPPAEATPGVVHEWKSKDGLAYRYRLPKNWDAEKGASLTFIWHGSNLDRRWGFANHSSETFRPDDIVVSPDGTSSNGNGGFNMLDNAKDLKRMHALHQELREAWTIGATFIYGHSQGSFFAFKYAGAYPDDVQGVLGHASGTWSGTARSKGHHHQAIVAMHGTDDPRVPFGQSLGAWELYRAAKYPNARMRNLQGWGHWPAEHNGSVGGSFVPHASQQLAWIEAMVTTDAARLTWCFEFLADVKFKDWHDYAALRSVATRVQEFEGVDAKVVERAGKAIAAVDALAKSHVELLRADTAEWKGKFPGEAAWVLHLPTFLREFEGVPAADEYRAEWTKKLEAHTKEGIKLRRKYWKAVNKGDSADAFAHGVAAIEGGFLFHECQRWDFLNELKAWREKSEELKLKKGAVKKYDAIVPALRKAHEAGVNRFRTTNEGVGEF